MENQPVIHATDQVRRLFYKPAETIFAALSDPAKLRAWYGSGGASDLLQLDVDFKVGGTQRVVYKFHAGSPVAGKTLVNEERFLHIVPNQRIVVSSVMAMDGAPFSASLVTFDLAPSGPGTELTITHQDAFFENADGPEMRRNGWISLIARLAEVVDVAQGASVAR